MQGRELQWTKHAVMVARTQCAVILVLCPSRPDTAPGGSWEPLARGLPRAYGDGDPLKDVRAVFRMYIFPTLAVLILRINCSLRQAPDNELRFWSRFLC
jgi:hypothetical protein